MLLMLNLTGLNRVYWLPEFSGVRNRSRRGVWFFTAKWLGVEVSVHGRAFGSALIRRVNIGFPDPDRANRVDLDTIDAMASERARVNSLSLADAEVYEWGRRVDVPREAVEWWKFTGLSHVDFLAGRAWCEPWEAERAAEAARESIS